VTESRHVYIVDDDAAFRSSLAALLEAGGWAVEEFASTRDFAEKAAILDAGVLLLDLHLGGSSGLDFLEAPGAELDRFAAVMVTGTGEIETAVRAMKAGAADFVEKPFRADELFDRLDRVHARLEAEIRDRSLRADAKRRVAALSGRERDVLERLLAGSSNKLIARELDISPRTVEMHRARMLDKLAVRSTTEAVELARLSGVKPIAAAPANGRDSNPPAD
jgi:two-component system response regulator FixJ